MKINHTALGHRQRLRDRFEANGIDSLIDYEILEMLLHQIVLYSDTQKTAKRLLEKFGTLKNVLSADKKSLEKIQGIGARTATLLYFFGKTFDYSYNKNRTQDILYRPHPAHSFYCSLKEKDYEVVSFLCYDKNFDLSFSGEYTQFSNQNVITPEFEELIDIIKALNTKYVMVAHNHPDGITHPSDKDAEFTYMLFKYLSLQNLVFLDHLIVAPQDVYSFYYSRLLAKMAKELIFEHPQINFSEEYVEKMYFPKSTFLSGHIHPNVLRQLYAKKIDPVPVFN